jgi:hypothetical protein
MQRLIFNGFMVVLGKGWGGGGALLSYVFSKSARNPKTTLKQP